MLSAIVLRQHDFKAYASLVHCALLIFCTLFLGGGGRLLVQLRTSAVGYVWYKSDIAISQFPLVVIQ